MQDGPSSVLAEMAPGKPTHGLPNTKFCSNPAYSTDRPHMSEGSDMSEPPSLRALFSKANGPSCPHGWSGLTMHQLPIGGTVSLNIFRASTNSPRLAVPAGGSSSPADSMFSGHSTNSLGVRDIRFLGFTARSHPPLSYGLHSTSYGIELFACTWSTLLAK